MSLLSRFGPDRMGEAPFRKVRGDADVEELVEVDSESGRSESE